MGDTKLWRLANRGYDPQDYIRERARLMRVDGNSRGVRSVSRRVPGEAMSVEQRAGLAAAQAREQRDPAPIVLPEVGFVKRRLPGEPKSLTERWK
jgi:hypothetical protein